MKIQSEVTLDADDLREAIHTWLDNENVIGDVDSADLTITFTPDNGAIVRFKVGREEKEA